MHNLADAIFRACPVEQQPGRINAQQAGYLDDAILQAENFRTQIDIQFPIQVEAVALQLFQIGKGQRKPEQQRRHQHNDNATHAEGELGVNAAKQGSGGKRNRHRTALSHALTSRVSA